MASSTSFSSSASQDSTFRALKASEGTFAALPYNANASISVTETLPIDGGERALSLRKALAYNVIVPTVEEGVPHDITMPSSEESNTYNASTNLRLSNVAGTRPSGEALLSDSPLSPVPHPMEKLHSPLPPPFLTKTYDMVEDVATNSVVSWSSGQNSFVVWNLSEFSQSMLPRYFKHNNFSSFVRQLNTYGFKKVSPDRWEFAHEAFLRGQKCLLKDIHRRKPGLHAERQLELDHFNVASVASAPESCVELGKFGLEGEMERLKHDKGFLAAEVVRLQHQQQSAECEIQAMAKRVQETEKRQELMMNFLAKAVQSPAFLSHLLQQSESFQIDHESRKRKRLTPGTEDAEVLTGFLMDPQVLIENSEFPSFSEKEKSFTDMEKHRQMVMYEADSRGKSRILSDLHTVQMEATAWEQAMEESCGVTSAVTSLGLEVVQETGKTSGNFDPSQQIRPGPSWKPLDDAVADLDLAFDLQDFLKELAPTVGDDVNINVSSSNMFGGTSNRKVHVNEASRTVKVQSETDHSTGEEERKDGIGACGLASHNATHNVIVDPLLPMTASSCNTAEGI